MKLEVGMYVRTTKGKIDKIDDYSSTFDCYHLSTEPKCYGIEEDDITKASHNIIDLIAVGDYVNGHKVEEIDYEDKDIYTADERCCGVVEFYEVKTIVTKEQFESMEYRVGE